MSSLGEYHAGQRLDPALRLRAPSLGFSLLGVLLGCMLIAAATWLGTALRSPPAAISADAQPLQVVDARRALVFAADRATGDIRVLNVRSGISEIARLHEAQRQDITAIALDLQGSILTVESANERYEYDARTFRLLTRSPVLAARQIRARAM